jgi:polyhydroxyalkanoate synthesis repressor PhaR
LSKYNTTIIIKKYPNRRLYNTHTSKYITLEDLSDIIKSGKDFKVLDIKTNEDLTRITLTQIILDHEIQGYNLLPIEFLKHIIRFYDHPLNAVFTKYISDSLEYFNNNQAHIHKTLTDMQGMVDWSKFDWTKNLDQINKTNIEMFNNFINSLLSNKK